MIAWTEVIAFSLTFSVVFGVVAGLLFGVCWRVSIVATTRWLDRKGWH